MKISAHIEERELKEPFKITGKEWTYVRSLVVQLESDKAIGRGEAQGVFYLDETADSIYDQAQSFASQVQNGISREELQDALPPGGARNALDCALWDLECKTSGKSIWELSGVKPGPVTTVFTIGLESTPEAMAEKARVASSAPVLKIKLDADRPYEKLSAIRSARPDATLVVDANQGWDLSLLKEILPRCEELELAMIEQPLPRGDDAELQGFESPVTLAADESCLHRGELSHSVGRYGMINIKLDKTGGLTEALALAREAKESGLKLMVGNMMGSSLSMAPSFVVAQLCDFVDIDGPLLLSYDCPFGLQYNNGIVQKLHRRLWG